MVGNNHKEDCSVIAYILQLLHELSLRYALIISIEDEMSYLQWDNSLLKQTIIC